MITKVKNMSRGMVMTANFEQDPNTTTGLTFGYHSGDVHRGGELVQLTAGTVTVPAGVSYVYLDVTNDPTSMAAGTLAQMNLLASYIPLYQVTAGGSITNVVDLRGVTTHTIGTSITVPEVP